MEHLPTECVQRGLRPDDIELGKTYEALAGNGFWCSVTVTGKNDDGTFAGTVLDASYTGDKDWPVIYLENFRWVTASEAGPDPEDIEIGKDYEGADNSGSWHRLTILAKNDDGTYSCDVRANNTSARWQRFEAKYFRWRTVVSDGRPSVLDRGEIEVGHDYEAVDANDVWHPVTITGFNSDDTFSCDVRDQHGKWPTVRLDKLRKLTVTWEHTLDLDEIVVGHHYEAKGKGSDWYPVVVTRKNEDGTLVCDMLHLNWKTWTKVHPRNMRRLPDAVIQVTGELRDADELVVHCKNISGEELASLALRLPVHPTELRRRLAAVLSKPARMVQIVLPSGEKLRDVGSMTARLPELLNAES